MEWDLAVAGGGAAGLSAAIAAAACGDRVIVLEKGNAAGRKVLASGNGRCNLMNTGRPRYYGDAVFAEKVFEAFPYSRLAAFWKHLGLMLTEESEGRVYPFTLKATSVMDALRTGLNLYHVTVQTQWPVEHCRKEKGMFILRCGEEKKKARRLLIACGGPAQPRLGGTEDGAKLLAEFGLHSVPYSPSLVSLTTEKKSISGLAGIRCRAGVAIASPEGSVLHQEKGEVLFTENGVSGICVMQCSRFAYRDGCFLELDFVQDLFPDQKTLVHELLMRKTRFSAFAPEQVLNGIVLPRISYAVMKQAGIAMREERAGDLSEEQIRRVAEVLKGYVIPITGRKGLHEAQVSAGGVICSQFSPENLESAAVSGLHAAGETLNVDGDCGGFNLMFAFASGILAGLNGRIPGYEVNE